MSSNDTNITIDHVIQKQDSTDFTENQGHEKESVCSNGTAVYYPQPDTLTIQDAKKVKRLAMNLDELTRLTRALPNLSPVQIRTIELRYIELLRVYKTRQAYFDFFFHFTRGFVSFGGVIVPALLSIQSPTSEFSATLYWATWCISVLVTMFHNFSTIFKLEKKYIGLHNTYERLVGEGWQYYELSGRYSGHLGHNVPTHLNQYIYFMSTIEKIRLRQVEEEYSTLKEIEKQPNTPDTSKPIPLSENPVPSPLDPNMNRGLNLTRR